MSSRMVTQEPCELPNDMYPSCSSEPARRSMLTWRAVSGCYTMHGCGVFSACPSCIYTTPCGDSPCGVPCWLGISSVVVRCVACVCGEWEWNAWVNRDKSGMETGEAVLVDKETGTFACYCAKCGTTTVNETPAFHARKLCC